MYDTSPDLQSYVFTLRRLWILPILLIIAAAIVGSVTKPAPAYSVSGAFQVPEPALLSTVSRLTTLYDAKMEAALLATEIEVADNIESLDVALRPGQSVVDVTFTADTDGGVANQIAAVNQVIAEAWETQITATVAPAREITQSTVDQYAERVAQWDTLEGEFAAVERIRAEQALFDARATLESLDNLPQQPPELSGIATSPPSGAIMRTAVFVAAALFLNTGVTVLITLIDKRVRRRSFLERNGLTVVSIVDAREANFGVVPQSILGASQKDCAEVAIVAMSSTVDLTPLRDALTLHEGIDTVVDTSVPAQSPKTFVDTVTAKDAVVLLVEAGSSDYVSVLEAARTAISAGAENVCAVIETRSRAAQTEALA